MQPGPSELPRTSAHRLADDSVIGSWQHASIGQVHPVLDLRRQHAGRLLDLDDRPADVAGRVQVVDERDRQAGDERERDVLPVLVLGVVDDRPALDHRRLVLLAEDQPVGRLPHRGRDGVGQPEPALALAPGEDREAPRILLLGRELRS